MMSLFAVGTQSIHDELTRKLEEARNAMDDDYTDEREIARQQQDVMQTVMEHSETGKFFLFFYILATWG